MNKGKPFKRIMSLSIFNLIFFSMFSCTDPSKQSNSKAGIETQNQIGMKDSIFLFDEGIISIFEDSKGHFWFGTKENGICKYNGIGYTYFTIEDGLPHDQIRRIDEDSNGNIVLRTGKGICLFDGNRFTQLSEPDTKEANSNWTLSANDVWYQVNANGILQYKGSELKYLQYPFAEKELTNGVHLPYMTLKAYKDNLGKVWFGTFNQGIIEYDGKEFRTHNPNSFGIGTIRAIFQDSDGIYWFGSNGGGLYRYNGEAYTNITSEYSLVNKNPTYDKEGTLSRIWAINQYEKDRMWFGTADSGLWLLDGETLTNFTRKDGLPSQFVDIIYKDSEGKLWFGSGENSRRSGWRARATPTSG